LTKKKLEERKFIELNGYSPFHARIHGAHIRTSRGPSLLKSHGLLTSPQARPRSRSRSPSGYEALKRPNLSTHSSSSSGEEPDHMSPPAEEDSTLGIGEKAHPPSVPLLPPHLPRSRSSLRVKQEVVLSDSRRSIPLLTRSSTSLNLAFTGGRKGTITGGSHRVSVSKVQDADSIENFF